MGLFGNQVRKIGWFIIIFPLNIKDARHWTQFSHNFPIEHSPSEHLFFPLVVFSMHQTGHQKRQCPPAWAMHHAWTAKRVVSSRETWSWIEITEQQNSTKFTSCIYSNPQIDGKVNHHQISTDLLFHLFGMTIHKLESGHSPCDFHHLLKKCKSISLFQD